MGRTMGDHDEAIYRQQLGGDLYALERAAISVNTRAAWAELDAERAHSAKLAERVAELEQMYAEMKDAADKGSKSVFAIAASQAENVRLREALYPLVVVALDADAREDAPEYVDGEPYNGMRALPECAACGGTGATDRNHYEDMPIPEEVFCGQCGGRGFLKHPVPATPCPTAALREVCEKVVWATKARCEDYHARYKMQVLPFNGADAEHVVSSILGPRETVERVAHAGSTHSKTLPEASHE